MNIKHDKYSHLSFDLWLTLIKSNPEFKSKRNLLFRDFFEADCSIEKVTEVVRYYDVLCNNINEKTGLNLDTYEIYYLILGALGINITEIETDKLDQFYKENELVFLQYKPELIYQDIHFLFDEVKNQGKTMSVLSNTGFIKGDTMKKLISHYGLDSYFSFQIYSDEEGISKPNYEIFQVVHDQINDLKKTQKKEVLHIGDNLIADYNGAKNFGFEAHLLKI